MCPGFVRFVNGRYIGNAEETLSDFPSKVSIVIMMELVSRTVENFHEVKRARVWCRMPCVQDFMSLWTETRLIHSTHLPALLWVRSKGS